MTSPKIRWWIFIGIALLALVIRLPRLGERSMHTDEAVNGYIIGQLLGGETYHYDPQDRHGPALYLATLPVVRAVGEKDFQSLSEMGLRLVPVLWGTLTILLFAAAAGRIGFGAAASAALLFAVSPITVYYNRYFIHETLFVAGTFALLLSGWRMLENKSWRAAVATGASASFILACKETAVLHFAALVPAIGWWLFKRRSVPTRQGIHKHSLIKLSVLALAVFAIVLVAFYTWGGKHWSGLTDLVCSLPRFASRASGEGHEKPIWYYLGLLGYDLSGCLVLAFAGVGAVITMRGRRTEAEGERTLFTQAVLIYGAAIGLIYSLIPYKTPWLALNFWLPLALLAGFGISAVWQKVRHVAVRAIIVLLVSVMFITLGHESWKWAFAKPADERNPYAYAHTGEDLLRLPEQLNRLVAEKTLPANPVIAVVMKDAWPLPWYLRRFSNVGFWQPDKMSNSADVYITPTEVGDALAGRLKNLRPEFFGVRPGVLIVLWTPVQAEKP